MKSLLNEIKFIETRKLKKYCDTELWGLEFLLSFAIPYKQS
jgi:hypothetical protein